MLALEEVITQNKSHLQPPKDLDINQILDGMRRLVEIIQQGWNRNVLRPPRNDQEKIRKI